MENQDKRNTAARAKAASDKVPLRKPAFAFIAGGPYTQKKNSMQFLFPVPWARWKTAANGTESQQRELETLLRAEWGLTDRWELDFVIAAAGARQILDTQRMNARLLWADTVLGLRYRAVQEPSAPLTLSLVPQLILPTGGALRGGSFGATGYAPDLTAAKDWGGPLFVYGSLNYAFFPSVRHFSLACSARFGLHSLFLGNALGVRTPEKAQASGHHDVNLFLEYGLGRKERIDAEASNKKPRSCLRSSPLTFVTGSSIPVTLFSRWACRSRWD